MSGVSIGPEGDDGVPGRRLNCGLPVAGQHEPDQPGQVGNRRMLGVQLCEYAIALVTLNQTANALVKWKAGTELLTRIGDGVALSDAIESMRATCARTGVSPLESS